jgi:ABC-type antimicrobial peptide transport system permease subunit
MFQIRDATGKMTSLFAMEVQMSTFVIAGSVAMLVGFLSALYPAWRAARINPIDVIRGI